MSALLAPAPFIPVVAPSPAHNQLRPDGFVRIRPFGLLAHRRQAAALAQCRALLAQPPPPPAPPESAPELMLRVSGIDIERGPSCRQGVLRPLAILPPPRCPGTPS